MTISTRAAAAHALASVLSGRSLNQSLALQLSKVDARERGLLQQLCYGTLRQLPKLNAILDQLMSKPLREKDSDVRALLLLGLYQLAATRVPDHAAVSATVEAVRELKKPWAKGLTNAVLRRYLRERDELEQSLDQAAKVAHPTWLYNKLRKQWPDNAQEIFAAANAQPPMTLRVNHQKISRSAYLEKLEAAGIAAMACTLGEQAITLAQPTDVTALPGFEAGFVSVQDEAAQMAATLLNPRAGERILDACAAPGGKTCHMLELQNKLAEMVAMDVDSERLKKVEENLQRLELGATLLAGDAAAPPDSLEQASFDAILVDAPCSAIGVIRRHPDVKTLRREKDIPQLAAQQLLILQGLWPLLKPGGRLLYATCSILNEENSKVVDRFLQLHSDAECGATEPSWGEACLHGRQLLPSTSGSDGLFYAMLEKSA
jgi:16S rRNA (cytosine967-C5)-methyltransferase